MPIRFDQKISKVNEDIRGEAYVCCQVLLSNLFDFRESLHKQVLQTEDIESWIQPTKYFPYGFSLFLRVKSQNYAEPFISGRAYSAERYVVFRNLPHPGNEIVCASHTDIWGALVKLLEDEGTVSRLRALLAISEMSPKET